ncbi:hypothetical protein FSP39_018383 [Pinctada imbricata]|uniref:Uncharacterized protein n=1 Tax=Pinctada imbricata TaxID=66713 RepID=A0AA88Y037_PINIB|nr:hypothetical protein FSP39_018383 [Pinctada imbricata]
MYSKQQILHAIISDGQKMMRDGEVENKEEFQQKLHLLAEQWQSVVRRANQRKAIIENSIRQWQTFNDQAERLQDWLMEKEENLEAFNVESQPLQGIKNLIERGKHLQEEIRSQEDKFKRLHEQSKPLLQKADDNAREEVKVKISQLQHQSHGIVGKLESHVTRLTDVLKQWQECEEDIEDILTWLKDTRKTLTSDLPTSYDLLQTELTKCKDIEAAFASSENKRQNLLRKEKRLAEILQPDDLNVLHQRIRLLNKQWDELHNQAFQRAQRIHDNMFRWSSFGDRIRDFHEWMDDMERKVLSSREYHIEDLLTKIQREYQEEMTKKEVTKNELMDQGRRLMKVSSEVRSAAIETKLQRANDRWEHLKSVIAFRQRKLQETLLAVQQLDVSMANLRKWLASMEHDLSGPMVYMECDWPEIQGKLQRQQELQKDIEHHSAGVGSVLNLCEVLLHDSDACPTDVEHNALQLAMTNLDKRWRNICQQSPARRSRIEETWELWNSLIADCKEFEDWLKEVEQDLIESVTEQLNSSFTKEEVNHFESLQREVHEHLKDLENINLQYRKLAREGRTDHSGQLKQKMTDCNTRWDKLQQQVSNMMQRLKESASMKEDYVTNRDMLYNWLTEMDVQITNIEHLSSMDIPTKMAEMKRLQDEIENKQRKIDQLNTTGLFLIQKGDSQEAFRIQKELEEFKNYHRQVLDRVKKYSIKLKRISEAQIEDMNRLERQTEPPSTALADWDLHDP